MSHKETFEQIKKVTGSDFELQARDCSVSSGLTAQQPTMNQEDFFNDESINYLFSLFI